MSMPSIKRMLLVEDNPGDARLLRELFKEQGSDRANLIHVECMREAEQYLVQHSVDLVLLDLGLQDAQGLEAVQRTRVAAPSRATA